MSKSLSGVGVVAAIAAVAGISYWAGTRSSAPAGAPASAAAKGNTPAGIGVEAVKVQMQRLPTALAAVGSLRSDETVIVRPEIAGRVAEIYFKEGERVAMGALLVPTIVRRPTSTRRRPGLSKASSTARRPAQAASSPARRATRRTTTTGSRGRRRVDGRVSKATIAAPFAGTIGLRQVSICD